FFSSRRRHTRSKRDWSSDVCSSDLREAQQLRSKHGLGNVPQLVIYRIDKGKQTEEEFRKARSTSSNRYPLNFEKDLIGINLMIPGVRKNKNLARKLKIVVPINEDDGDSHKEDEE